MAVVIVKDVEEQDIPVIEGLLFKVFGTKEYKDLKRLGGLTNHTYCVTLKDGSKYAVRVPGEGTEEVIVRKDEKVSTELACELGIDAKLLLFDDKGCKVTEFIPDAVTMDEEKMQTEDSIGKAAAIFRKLHSSGVDTGVRFEVFEMAVTYEKFISDNGVALYDDYADIKEEVEEIKRDIYSRVEQQTVPCHNDPLCANWVKSGERLYLIDWEYAGMNDGIWDLAATSIEARYNSGMDDLFLSRYFGHAPSSDEKKHLIANKIFVDYLWTLWAKMRVPFDGQPMEDWAQERYTRMKGFIRNYGEI